MTDNSKIDLRNAYAERIDAYLREQSDHGEDNMTKALIMAMTPSQLKPRVRRLVDDYAKSTGKHWACTNGVFIARGETPELAYKAFMGWIKRNRLHDSARELLRFA